MQCKGGFEHPEGENWSITAEAQKPSVAPTNYPVQPKLLYPGIQDATGSGHTIHPLSRDSLSHPHQIELSSSSYIPSHALPLLIWIPLPWMFWSPSENLQTLLSFEGQGQIFVLPQAFVTKVTSSLSEFSQSEKWGPLVHAIVLCVSYLPEAESRAVVSERYPENTLHYPSEHQWCSSTKVVLRKFDI